MTLAACNLRVNPFGAPFRHERGHLAVPAVDLEILRRRLEGRRCAIQLLGRPGSGKSTHLCALHERFPNAPLTIVPQHIGEGPVVFVDEAQRARLDAERFRQSSWVLATHRSYQRELRRAGLEVYNVRLAGLMPPLLHRYVALRMEWARLGPGPLPSIPAEIIEALWRTHGADVRAIENGLYDWLQYRKDVLVVH
jgi:hypothetical protein